MRMWVGRLGGGERVVETVGSVVLVCVVAVAMGRSGPRQGQLGPCVLRERRLGLCHGRGRGTGLYCIVFPSYRTCGAQRYPQGGVHPKTTQPPRSV